MHQPARYYVRLLCIVLLNWGTGYALWAIGRNQDPFRDTPACCWGPSSTYMYFVAGITLLLFLPMDYLWLRKEKTILRWTALFLCALVPAYYGYGAFAVYNGLQLSGCAFTCMNF